MSIVGRMISASASRLQGLSQSKFLKLLVAAITFSMLESRELLSQALS